MAVYWQPNMEFVNKICGYIASKEHDQFQQIVDLNNYLAFILARAEDKSPEVREVAGLCLKDNLKSSFEYMAVENQEYIKSEFVYCIRVGDMKIKSSVGTVISVRAQLLGFSQWPELLQALQNCLSSDHKSRVEFALDILVKIFDNKGRVSSPESFFHLCRPLFLILDSEDVVLKEQSSRLVNQCIKLIPSVCEAFMQLIKDLQPSRLMRYLCGVIECVIQLNNDNDQFVAMRACQFWLWLRTYVTARRRNILIKNPLIVRP